MKASPNRAFQKPTGDPKPGELTMSRVNSDENRREARTRCRSNDMRRLVVRGDIPNEPGDSWFSLKYI